MTTPFYIDKITQVFESRGNLHIKAACSTGGVDASGADLSVECLHLVMPMREALVSLPKVVESLPTIISPTGDTEATERVNTERNLPSHDEGETLGASLSFKISER